MPTDISSPRSPNLKTRRASYDEDPTSRSVYPVRPVGDSGRGALRFNLGAESRNDLWHMTHRTGLDLPPKMDYTPAALGKCLNRPQSDKKRTVEMNLPLKWHGGKYYLASRIVSLMPPHLHYVEPFFGGGAVLLARNPEDPALWLLPHKGVSEVVNDINGRLINFWRVLRDPDAFASFGRWVEVHTDGKAGMGGGSQPLLWE